MRMVIDALLVRVANEQKATQHPMEESINDTTRIMDSQGTYNSSGLVATRSEDDIGSRYPVGTVDGQGDRRREPRSGTTAGGRS
jgi:hypothetical protein